MINREITAVLVGGLPRAGTTLLSDLLNECPEVAVMAEYRFADLLEHLKPILQFESDHNSTRRRIESQSEEEVHSTQAPTKPNSEVHYHPFSTPNLNCILRYPTVGNFPEIAAAVVKTSLGKPAARVVGSKTPGTMLCDAENDLDKLFPDVRYIAMLRSPMTQINSSMNRRNRARVGVDEWNCETIDDAIEQYISVISGLIVLQERVGESLMCVKYEDLLHKPAEVLQGIAKHVGLEALSVSEGLIHHDRGEREVLTEFEKSRVRDAFSDVLRRWDSGLLTGSEIEWGIFSSILPDIPTEPHLVGVEAKSKFLVSGWSTLEPDGVWSCCDEATLLFGPAPDIDILVSLEFSPYLAGGKPLKLDFTMNGEPIGEVLLCPGEQVIGSAGSKLLAVPDWTKGVTIWLGPTRFRGDAANLLKVTLHDPVSPASLGVGEDTRRLGIKLKALRAVVLAAPKHGAGGALTPETTQEISEDDRKKAEAPHTSVARRTKQPAY